MIDNDVLSRQIREFAGVLNIDNMKKLNYKLADGSVVTYDELTDDTVMKVIGGSFDDSIKKSAGDVLAESAAPEKGVPVKAVQKVVRRETKVDEKGA